MKQDNFQRRTRQSLFIAILVSSFAALGFAQTTDEEAKVIVPEPAMREVVRRILIYSFKPRNKRTEIRLYERGIKSEWLPEIKNVEFQLVPEAENDSIENVYFFNLVTLEKGVYGIGFGFGNPNCEARGNTFYFRLAKQKVKLWLGDGFGMGCGSSEDYGAPEQ